MKPLTHSCSVARGHVSYPHAGLRVALSFLSALLFLCSAACQQGEPVANFDQLAAQAAAARDQDRLDQAIALYKKALALRPEWADGWFSLGTIEYDGNQFEAAARDFERLVPLAPTDGTSRAMLGLCEFELGNDPAALKDLREGRALGVANDPQLQEVVVYHEGILLLRAGQFKLAQSTFGTLCKMGVADDQAMQGMGLAVLRIAPVDASSLGLPGSDVLKRVGNAACLTSKKKFAEANEEYTKLLQDQPGLSKLNYAYGLFLVASNDVPRAVEEFKIEIERNPKDTSARLEIAAALYKVDSSAALPYAQQAVELNPAQPFAHYLLGLLLLDTNDYAKAIPQLEIAAKAFPKEKKLFFALGSAYARAGRREDAEKARATFERLSREPESETSTSY